MISKVVSSVNSKTQSQQQVPDPSPGNEIFERKLASSCCYEYPVTNKTEMQGAKHVFRKKAKMASIALVLEVYSEKTNIH